LSIYHKVFEIVVKWYSGKKDSKTLIDGLGQNIKKGPFSREWLTSTQRIKFDGLEIPVPIGYDGYLRHFYGNEYMNLLPISKRVSGHHLARIDMGGNIFSSEPDIIDRELSLEGELFE
jgi:hypothetical protein